MKTIARLFLLIVFMLGCSPNNEQLKETKSDYLGNITITVGNGNQVQGTAPFPLQYMAWSVLMPMAPFNPSGNSTFSMSWYIANPLLTNGLRFRIYRIDNPSYYVATVDYWTDNGGGGIVYHSNVLQYTAWPESYFKVYWQSGLLTLYVTDTVGNVLYTSPTIPIAFTTGVKPTRWMSPTVSFGISDTVTHHGCDGDMPAYDDGGMYGNLWIQAKAGTSPSLTTEAIISSPLSGACDTIVSNFSDSTNVRWTP